MQRSLPAADRFAFAKGFYDAIGRDGPLERDAYFASNRLNLFPETTQDDADIKNLGFDYAISGARGATQGWRDDVTGMALISLNALHFCWQHNLCRTKQWKLQNLCNRNQQSKTYNGI